MLQCRSSGETADLLLLHYDIVYALWSFVFSVFGVKWAMLRIIVDIVQREVSSTFEGVNASVVQLKLLFYWIIV